MKVYLDDDMVGVTRSKPIPWNIIDRGAGVYCYPKGDWPYTCLRPQNVSVDEEGLTFRPQGGYDE